MYMYTSQLVSLVYKSQLRRTVYASKARSKRLYSRSYSIIANTYSHGI